MGSIVDSGGEWSHFLLLRFDLHEKFVFAFLASSEESLNVLLTYISILGWHCVIQDLCENWKNEDFVNFVFFKRSVSHRQLIFGKQETFSTLCLCLRDLFWHLRRQPGSHRRRLHLCLNHGLHPCPRPGLRSSSVGSLGFLSSTGGKTSPSTLTSQTRKPNHGLLCRIKNVRGVPGRERGSYVLRCVSLETLETLEILNLRRSLSEKRATSSSSSRIQNLGLVCRTKEVSENSYMLGLEAVVNCSKHKKNLDGTSQLSNSDPDRSDKDAWTINVVKKLQEFNDGRHVVCVRTLRLMRSEDIESNPGPTHGETGRIENTGSVVTYNVRGLKDEGKMRHLLNYCHKGADSTKLDSFYLFQETYIETPGKIPYLWRGNYYLTPGEGNSGGCLTLMSNHISVVSSRVIEKRAHILACQKNRRKRSLVHNSQCLRS